jgi:hypothetical protein
VEFTIESADGSVIPEGEYDLQGAANNTVYRVQNNGGNWSLS